MNKKLDQEAYAALARRAAAEGLVLLENKNEALPIKKGETVAVFGRIAFDYYKSGLGSGGLVNTRYVVGILDALEAEEGISVHQGLRGIYEAWLADHPFDEGKGWGQVPWCQEEMPVDDATLAVAADADAAIVIIGRTAGEDQDNADVPGSYRLTAVEEDMLAKVCSAFARTIVVLNVGNIVDMSWVQRYEPAAVLYAWHGGQEGGNGVCDVLVGRVNPCGKLTDTIARSIADYPSDAYFGDPDKNYYSEDIYVGYRYFETFAKESVLYPFGFGLSYTSFDITAACDIPSHIDPLQPTTNPAACDQLQPATPFTIPLTVTNTGAYPGKEVVQAYIKAPDGQLGKSARSLVAFAKTDLLSPGETQTLDLTFDAYSFASFDDSGATGHKNCYVLEAGEYGLYVGSDVRSAQLVSTFTQDFTVLEQLGEAYAPAEAFERMTSVNGELAFAPVPTRTIDPYERMTAELPEELAYTGDKGYKLVDVLDGNVTLDDFIAQLSDEDLICLFRGEGMCSPKVTPGTGSAFGGITTSLSDFGIPAVCCSDGPSGIRMDCGTKAFSLPNGTLLACTFDVALNEELFGHLGLELRRNRVDNLLGPGMNLHRHPLNGRNFEYFSEDPLLTGRIGSAQIKGLALAGVTGTIKHFAGNNQETNRRQVQGLISQRALRELYLKGFELAVKEGGAKSIMSTYGPVNGIWTGGSYDLLTTILRGEWGYEGIVMSDWWAEANVEGSPSAMSMRWPMVAAGNDLYMVCGDAEDMSQDNVQEALVTGQITRGQLQRNAKNILAFILDTPAMLYEAGRLSPEEFASGEEGADSMPAGSITYFAPAADDTIIEISPEVFPTAKGQESTFGLCVAHCGTYDMELTLSSPLDSLAQLSLSVYYDNALKHTVSIRGSQGQQVTEVRDMGMFFGNNHYIRLYLGSDGLDLHSITFRLREKVEISF